MDLNYSPEEEEFRSKVRRWLEENLPGSGLRGAGRIASDKSTLQKMRDWHRQLYEAGYLALSWPKEYGGQALDPIRQALVNEEMVRARAPGAVGGGIPMLGPTLITWGTEEQKKRYLPRVLTGEEIWCQGYSEPGAGSDLAALRTRAELSGDEFIINGQKIWTSGVPLDLQQLFRQMGCNNPSWGEERIANELLPKLGLRVSQRTIRKYLPRAGRAGWQTSWRSALVNFSQESRPLHCRL